MKGKRVRGWGWLQLRQTEGGEEEGLHRPIVSPSTHKGRRRRRDHKPRLAGVMAARGTSDASGCSCHGNQQTLMSAGVRKRFWVDGSQDNRV